ncbi:hypothetical protein FGB62_239g00 [Gracilaria domingensis]|nr:hypothetical protein FGB62_239g00 [Gracilaria domingensis]
MMAKVRKIAEQSQDEDDECESVDATQVSEVISMDEVPDLEDVVDVANAPVKRLMKLQIIPTSLTSHLECIPCVSDKFKKSFRGSLSTASHPGHLHTDITTAGTDSHDGFKYYIAIVDEYTRFLFTRPIRLKSEASEVIFEYAKCFERHSGAVIRSLHSDGGLEFFRAQKRLRKERVNISTTSSYTPSSNGLAESYIS